MGDATINILPPDTAQSYRTIKASNRGVNEEVPFSVEERSRRSVSTEWRKDNQRMEYFDPQNMDIGKKIEMTKIQEDPFLSHAQISRRKSYRSTENEMGVYGSALTPKYYNDEFDNDAKQRDGTSKKSTSIDRYRRSLQRDNLTMLSEAASMITQLNGNNSDNGYDSPNAEFDSTKQSNLLRSSILDGYLESPALKNRLKGQPFFLTPRPNIRSLTCEYLSNPSSHLRSRLAAAKVFYHTGYPLSSIASLDCNFLINNFDLSWLHEDIDSNVGLPPVEVAKATAISEDVQKDLKESLNVIIEKVKKAEEVEMKQLMERTGLIPHFQSNGTYSYIDPPTGYSIPPEIYANKYLAHINSASKERQRDFLQIAEKAYDSWMQSYVPVKRKTSENNKSSTATSNPSELEMKRMKLCASFSTLAGSIPKVKEMKIAKEKKEHTYPLLQPYNMPNGGFVHDTLSNYLGRQVDLKNLGMLPTVGRLFHPIGGASIPENK